MKKEYLEYFLDHQDQLFPEEVAATIQEADEFLEDCMAEVLDSLDDVREYFDEAGMDVSDLTDEELEEAEEVFCLPDGKYLVLQA